jgi:hypothetical protein
MHVQSERFNLIGVNMKTITIEIRSQYGNTVAYPACQAAKLFARIAGTKTLSSQALKDIQALGFDITCFNSQNTLELVK